MDLFPKYHINTNRYLGIILSLKDTLPIEIVYTIAIICIELSKSHFIHSFEEGYVLQISNKTHILSKDMLKLSPISGAILKLPLDKIQRVYTSMHNHEDNYRVIKTDTRLYMIHDRKLKELSINNFVTASVGRWHNMILTTDTVLATGENTHGHLGVGIKNYNCYLIEVKLPNVQSVACG